MMGSEQLNIGLIGAGRIGQLHAEHLTHRVKGAALVAIADVHMPSAEKLGARLGVSEISDRPSEILQNPTVDAVVICSSTETHASLITQAAEAGKHIFCEKPIDFNLDRIDQALNAVRAAGVNLQIGFNRRFDPNFHHVQEQVRSGAIGETHLVRITSRDPSPPPIEYLKVSGGIFLDMTIHDFDMARYLVGSEVVEVFATGACRVDPAIAEAGDIDTAVVVLTFQNGCIATIDNSRKADYGYDQRVEVFGSKGVVWADNNTPYRTGLGTAEGMQSPKPLDFFMERYADSYILEMESFVDSVQAGTEPKVTGLDGRIPVVIGLAAKRSLEEGRLVRLAEIQ
jgi:myo-inositol 2-dehydrogenase/D-chiro-inositol 1-dehydrogenase